MKFKKIQWRNLLSYGNRIQSYEFSDKPELVLVQGNNGSGKSAIKEALTVSAFGRSAIRKIKDLPNWINKNAYTYTEFETSKGDSVIIERGIDPNFSDISINGVKHNLPDKRKIDEFVEDELLGMTLPMFSNIISLSFDDFKSFVNLSTADKRKIIDPIFGIDILSDMKGSIKDDLRDKRRDLELISSNITRNKDLLESSILQLEELTERINQKIEDRSVEINKSIEDKTEIMESHKKKFNELKAKRSKIDKKIEDIQSKIYSHGAKISEYESSLKIFENSKCPYCFSDLTDKSAQHIKQGIIDKKKDEEELLKNVREYRVKADDMLKTLKKDQDVEKDKFYELNSDIKSLQNELKKAKDSIQEDEGQSIKNIIETIKKKISNGEDEFSVLRDDLYVFETIDEVLSDKGLKKDIIDRVIPLLNSRIVEISDRLDFKFDFEFDSEFNPIIKYMGMEISAGSLSTGQRKKMNLIVLLSFIEIIKMKHGNANVLFLDEIFSGLDKNNVYKSIEILREYADNFNMTIFVVSHEHLPEEFFDKRITVSVKNHFSEMIVTTNTSKNKN